MINTNTYIKETIPYFYIIQHKTSKKMYAGSKWAVGCNPSTFMIPNGYTTSSAPINSIIDLEGFDSFVILRIDTNLDGLSAYDYESLFLQTNGCARSKYWYNYHDNTNLFPPLYGTLEFENLMYDKFGVSNAFQSPIIQDQIKQSNLKNNGVEYPMQSPTIREKSRQTSLKVYGCVCPLQNPEVRQKSQNTMMLKYGVPDAKQIIVTCPHCNKSGAITGLKAKHFDNCKLNPNIKYTTCPHCNISHHSKSVMKLYHFDNCKSNPNYIKKIKPLIQCPYCIMESINKTNMTRYHFDNCKLKP